MSENPESPQTPPRDDQANEEFGTTEAVGDGGYPEEAPDGAQTEGERREGRPEQPQREEG